MVNMKLCKDCKHCKPEVFNFLLFKKVDYKYAKCSHKLSISLVDGEAEQFCDISRKYSLGDEYCTPEGRYWQAK